jgi:hypothetical protein
VTACQAKTTLFEPVLHHLITLMWLLNHASCFFLLLCAQDGRQVRVASKASVSVHPGDRFLLLTPGGGAFGERVATEPATKKARLA